MAAPHVAYGGQGAGFWVAELDGQVVGTIGVRPACLRSPLPSGWTKGDAELVRMYVSPNVRRCGAAAALVAALREFCLEHGYERVVLSSAVMLKGAQPFY